MKNKLIKLLIITLPAMILVSCNSGVQQLQQAVSDSPITVSSLTSRQLIERLEAEGVQVIHLGQTIKLVINSQQLFTANTANLINYNSLLLHDVAAIINSYNPVSVEVAAYASPITGKKEDYMQALTTHQAQQVVKILGQLGVNTRLLYALGNGTAHPVSSNDLASGQVANQRVEITFRYKPHWVAYN